MSTRTPARTELSKQSSGRFCSCGAPLGHTFVDLGSSPLANSYLSRGAARASPRPSTRCTRYVCERVLARPARASSRRPRRSSSDYAYFSSYSDELGRARASATSRRWSSASASAPSSQVVEIASNDGYLLQYFVERGVPVLGIEPAANVAAVAEESGIPTLVGSSARDRPRGSRPSGSAPTCWSATTCSPTCPT